MSLHFASRSRRFSAPDRLNNGGRHECRPYTARVRKPKSRHAGSKRDGSVPGIPLGDHHANSGSRGRRRRWRATLAPIPASIGLRAGRCHRRATHASPLPAAIWPRAFVDRNHGGRVRRDRVPGSGARASLTGSTTASPLRRLRRWRANVFEPQRSPDALRHAHVAARRARQLIYPAGRIRGACCADAEVLPLLSTSSTRLLRRLVTPGTSSSG